MKKRYISIILILAIAWLTGCGSVQNDPDSADANNENKKHTEDVQAPDGSADPNTENGGEMDNTAPIRDVSIVPEEYREIITQRAKETLTHHNDQCERMETMQKENNLRG